MKNKTKAIIVVLTVLAGWAGAEVITMNPDTPTETHIGWNDAIWGDPAVTPSESFSYVADRKGIWLLGLGKKHGAFEGGSLTLRNNAALFVSGGGPLGGTLILDGGQLQNRFARTAILLGKIRVDSESKVLNIEGNLELRTQLAGEGDLVVGAFRKNGQTVVFNGNGTNFTGTFILADSGADNVSLTVEFQQSYPSAGLAFRTKNNSRMPVLMLKGDLHFKTARLPGENGGMIDLAPGSYDADALKAAGVLGQAFKNDGGMLSVGQ